MLLQKLHLLRKSGINKGNAINYLAFIEQIVHVWVENQTAAKQRDAINGKEEEPGARFSKDPVT